MADNFNINNLELDDNTFEVLPDGDYHFTVESHEVGYATSEKMPPNTQQIACYLEIPFMKDGEVKTAKVRNNLNVYKKALFAIRQFVECIGMVPEKGKVKIDLEKMDGMTGVCSLTTRKVRRAENSTAFSISTRLQRLRRSQPMTKRGRSAADSWR